MATKLTPCPYCSQPRTDAAFAIPSPEAASDDGVSDEIKRLEDLIARLQDERSRLLRQRNERQSPIYALPPETLALVFQFAYPAPDFLEKYGLDSSPPLAVGKREKHPQFILSAVSARWRGVVLSTPCLWVFVNVDVTINKDRDIIQAFFIRSGSLPISLSLAFRANPTTPATSLTTLVGPILQEHRQRIRALRLLGISKAWVDEYIHQFTNLEHLIVDGDPAGVLFFDSPSTHLVLKDFRSRVCLSWSNVTVLHLHRMPVDVCLELLEKCTQLVEYRVRKPGESLLDDEIPAPNSPFVVPLLKLFEWYVDTSDRFDRAMLRYIRTPVLRTLIWNEETHLLQSLDAMRTFFDHLPSTLSVLQIENAQYDLDSSLFTLICNVHSIEYLVLQECFDDFVNDFLEKLGSASCIVENQQRQVLPRLRSIVIERRYYGGGFGQDKMLHMLIQRSLHAPTRVEWPFRIEFKTHQVDWTPEFKEKLREMVELGLNVELLEASKLVDWLL